MSGTGRQDPDLAPAVEGHDDRGPLPSPRRDLPIVDVLRLQRASCGAAGSVLYARVLGAMIDDVESGGPCAALLGPWQENAMADATPLRFLAAVHALVLDGSAPGLAGFYPSAGGGDDGDPAPAFLAAVHDHADRIAAGMHRNVQTNEVGRAAALLGGFLRIGDRTGLPLRCLEVGSSAGLLLRWDHYGYRVDAGTDAEVRWGDPDALCFDDPWTDVPPPLPSGVTVADRRGCDVAPIDPTTDAGVLRLRSFLWPDQVERRRRLDAALEVAAAVPATVDEADAGAWVTDQLAGPATGMATVVHHSIVLQYLPRPSFERMRAAIAAAGDRATPDATVHWLRMEPAGPVADIRLRSWWGDGRVDDVVLATSGYHGPPVTWLAGGAATERTGV